MVKATPSHRLGQNSNPTHVVGIACLIACGQSLSTWSGIFFWFPAFLPQGSWTGWTRINSFGTNFKNCQHKYFKFGYKDLVKLMYLATGKPQYGASWKPLLALTLLRYIAWWFQNWAGVGRIPFLVTNFKLQPWKVVNWKLQQGKAKSY